MAFPDYTDNSAAGLESRLADIQKPIKSSPITGGIAVLDDPNEAANAEKTARWAIQDMASKAKYAGTKNLDGLASALTDYTKTQGGNPDLLEDVNQRLRFGYADGGKIDPEALLAQMRDKYKVGNTSAPAPQPAAPAPAPTPATSQPSGMVQSAVGALRGRAAQIDKAVGYNKGGKVKACARGGKIKGPGTSTSDSIPAKVKQTGEDILVSNGERILSAKQDQLLHRIAMERGFESVDQMLEHGTGEPVGPTIVAGKKAAANGLPPTEETLHNGPYTSDGGSLLSDFNKWQTDKIASTNAKIDAATGKLPQASYSNEGRSVPAPITDATQRPDRVAAASAEPPPSPILSPMAPALTTKDVVPNGFTDRGAGIVGSRNAKGQLNVTNTGTEGFSDKASPIVDGSASALIDQRGSTYNPAAQLERMQRMRMVGDLTNSEITDPSVRQQAIAALAAMNQGAKANLENAQAGQANAVTAQTQQMEQMRGKLLDPSTPPEERARLIQALQAINGKQEETKIAEAQTFDPANPMVPIKVPYAVRGTQAYKVEDLSRSTQPRQAPATQQRFEVGKTYTDGKGNKAVYQADGTWKEIK